MAAGDARFRITLGTQPGPSGRLRLTPTVEVDLGSGAHRVQAIVDLLEAIAAVFCSRFVGVLLEDFVTAGAVILPSATTSGRPGT